MDRERIRSLLHVTCISQSEAQNRERIGRDQNILLSTAIAHLIEESDVLTRSQGPMAHLSGSDRLRLGSPYFIVMCCYSDLF